MAVCAGLIVANLYYCQPLIPLIAKEYDLSIEKVGKVTYLTQIGYALGLLFIVPLGDILERKKQILVCTVATSFFLFLASVAPTFTMLEVCCVFIGITSVVPQLVLPFAALLASEEQRGKVIGIVMSGLLIGILASRSLSGTVGYLIGWRMMFFLASIACLAMLAAIFFLFPRSQPPFSISYGKLMKSVLYYFNTEPVLRICSLLNALSFAVVSSFWVTMVLFLSNPPFNYDPFKIGLFGLAGAAGALAAPLAGKLTRPDSGNRTIRIGLICELVSFVIFGITGSSVLLLIGGIILLDVGHQIIQITNQIKVYSLRPEARNRLNTVFMTTYFMGGAIGAAIGIGLWNAGGWTIYCIGCGVLILVNMLFFYLTKRAV